MKALKTSLLVGAAAIAVIGLTGAALSRIEHGHVMRIRLPDGSLEQIRYVGDTPPVIRLAPGLAPIAEVWPDDLFVPYPAFAALERLSAQMDREAAALTLEAPGPTLVDLGALPPGVSGYSVVSTLSGGKVCTRTVRYGPADGSDRPVAVTRVSGDCADPAPTAEPPAQAVRAPEPTPARRPGLQTVSASL